MFSKKCFQKIFPQESVKNLFNPKSYILTQRKIYTYNTNIKNSIVFKKRKTFCLKEKERRGYVFEVGEGVETPMYTMSWRSLLIDKNIQSK